MTYETIPLLRKDGSVAAHALVDDDDFVWLDQWVWRYDARDGYARRGRGVKMHRLVLGLEPGDGKIGDHINGDRLDNRRSNLRVVSAAGNAQNTLGKAASRSAFRGVSWARALAVGRRTPG
jgi:hypothetical protein